MAPRWLIWLPPCSASAGPRVFILVPRRLAAEGRGQVLFAAGSGVAEPPCLTLKVLSGPTALVWLFLSAVSSVSIPASQNNQSS